DALPPQKGHVIRKPETAAKREVVHDPKDPHTVNPHTPSRGRNHLHIVPDEHVSHLIWLLASKFFARLDAVMSASRKQLEGDEQVFLLLLRLHLLKILPQLLSHCPLKKTIKCSMMKNLPEAQRK